MVNNKIIDLSALQEFLAKCDIRYQATLVSGTNIKTINNTTLLGSGNYAFDSEFSEVSTNALQNQVISKEIREINYELAVIRESLFATTLTEIDYEEQWATLYTIPETLSDNDGTHRLVYSETQLKMAKGNSVVVNQLVQNGNFANGTNSWTKNNASIVFSVSNGVAHAEFSNNYTYVFQKNSSISGHKYLYYGEYRALQGKISNFYGSTNFVIESSTWTGVAKIIDGTGSNIEIDILRRASSEEQTVVGEAKNIIGIDLTQEFPINTPTSVDDVRVKWLIAQGYIPTNSGTLASTIISGVKVRGFNQFDEILSLGSIDNSTGEEVSGSSNLRSGFIKVKPNTQYCFRSPIYGTSNYLARVHFYDKNQNYLGNELMEDLDLNYRLATTPSNCIYVRFVLVSGYGTTYNHDICINVSNANLNGQYKPYVEYTISVPQTTLRSAGSVQDYLEVVEGDIVEGEQLYNVVKHTFVGNIYFDEKETLGTWSKSSGNNIYIFTSNSTNFPYAFDINVKAISDKYMFKGSVYSGYATALDEDKSFLLWSSTNLSNTTREIAFRNDSITTLENWKTYISSNNINALYELATPTTETIATNLHFDQVSALIEQGGTIEPIYTDVPCDLTTTFVVKKAVGE